MVVPLLPPGSAIPLSHILLMPPSQTDITLPSTPTVYSLGSYPLPSTPVVPPERLQAQAPSQLDSVSSVTGQGMEQGDVGEFQRFEGNIPGFISYFLNTGGAAEKDSGLTSQECGGEGGAKKKPGKRPRKEEGDGGGEKTTDGNWEACTRTRSGNVGGTRERGILRAVLKKRGRGGGVIGSCSNIRAGPISRRQPVRIRIKRHLDQEDTLDGRAGISGGRASRRGCRPRRGTLTFCPPCERAPSYPPPTAPSLPQSSCPAPSLSLAPDFLHTLPLPPAPQPTGEDSIEQIEKLLEDVMTGLNFLPPQVVASEAESGHGNSCSNASLRDPGHDLTKPSSHVSDAAAMVTVTSSSMMTETASCFTSPIETQADPNGSLLEALLKVPLPPTHRSGPPYTAHCQRGEGRPRSGRRDERSLQGAGSHIQEEGKATRQHACAVIGSPALPFHNSATCETSIPGLPPSGAAGSMRIRAISPNMHLPSDPSREAAVPEVPQQIGGELNNILDHFLWTFENQSSLQGSGEVAVTDDMNTTTRLANEPSAMNGPGQHGSVLHRSGIQGCAGLNEPTHTGASQVSGKQSSAELNGTDSKCRHTTRQIMISGFPGGDKPRDSCCSPITGRGSGPGLEPVKENGLSGPTQGAAGVCRQKRSRPKRRGGSRKVWTKDRKQRIVTRRQNKEKKGVKGEEKDEKKNSSSQGRRSLKRGVDGLSQTQEDGTNGEVWHTRAKRLNSWEQNTDSLQKAELGGGRTMKGRPENGSHMGKRTSVCLVRLPGDCVNRTTRVCSAKPHEDCTGKQGFCLHKMEDFTYRTGPKSKSPAHHQWKTRNGGSHYMQEEERIVRVGEGKAAERPLKRGCVHPLDRRLKPREVPQVQQNEKGEWPLHQQRLREGGSEGEERRGLRSQRDISLLRRRKRRMDSEELTQAPSVKLRVVHAGKGGNAGEERGVEFGQEEPRARPHAGPESEPKLGDQCCDQSRRPVKGRVTGASPPMSSAFQKIGELLEHHQQSKSARESKNQQEGEAERVGDSQQEGEGEREGDSQQEGEGEREGDSQQEGEEEREGDSQQEGEEEREGDSQQKGDEEKDGDAEKDIGRGIFGGERKAEAGKGLVDSVTGMDRGMPEKEGAVDKTGSDKPEEQQEEQTVEGRVEDRVERDMDDESGNTSVSVDGGLHVTATVGRSVTLQSQNPLMASTINSDVIPNGEGAEGEKDREGVSKQRSVSAALCEESKLPLSSHSLIGQVLPPIQVSRWVTELSAGSFEQEDDDEEVEVDVMDSPCPTPLPLILLPGSWGEGLNPVTSSEDEDEEQYIDVIGEETD
ncbi:hypothetical protein JZ751_008744 [Albula glossodonta]|uniref:Uncharacterized protein n=1 Tax=Albula glossodonta TaxID=121402 RepID=A0A8T2P1L5_9TELE|nr:hypothetical protein JZ751_008744 [Albula glossodonta]